MLRKLLPSVFVMALAVVVCALPAHADRSCSFVCGPDVSCSLRCTDHGQLITCGNFGPCLHALAAASVPATQPGTVDLADILTPAVSPSVAAPTAALVAPAAAPSAQVLPAERPSAH